MVSHDRHLLSTVTDRFLLVDSGRVAAFDGDLADYEQWLASGHPATAPKESASKDAASKASAAKAPAPQQRRREDAEKRRELAPLRSRLTRCEKRLAELAAEATRLDESLARPELYEKGAANELRDLTAQRARVAQQTGELENEWLEISEQLENAG